MPSIVSPTDFQSGVYKLSQDAYSATQLQAVIDQYESYYLNRLFGVALYALYDNNVARFQVITAPFTEQTSGSTGCIIDPATYTRSRPRSTIHQSFGLKDMLCGFVYYHFGEINPMKATPSGMVKIQNEVSTPAASGREIARLQQAFNRAVGSYQEIQWYMSESEHAGNYPEYQGEALKKMYLGGSI